MLIISKFKDYYDYISHIYGRDNHIVYVREEISEELCKTTDIKKLSRLPQSYSTSEYIVFKWLVVCGIPYLIFSKEYDYGQQIHYEIVTEKDHPEMWVQYSKHNRFMGSSILDAHAKESEYLIKMSRHLNAPIFIVSHRGVESRVPCLNDFKFSSIKSPEQIYQDISYFMGNIINESPDMMPKSVMTDKEKIIGHGFDNKISFRHRK